MTFFSIVLLVVVIVNACSSVTGTLSIVMKVILSSNIGIVKINLYFQHARATRTASRVAMAARTPSAFVM